jgi:hypothetical protein
MGSLADASGRRYKIPQQFDTDKDRWLRELSVAVHNLFQGKMNNTARATLSHGLTSTTVSDARVGPNSVIQPMPTNLNAAFAFTTWAVSSRTNGSFIVQHVSTSTSDCTFDYSVIG